jgi:hypothetical protein
MWERKISLALNRVLDQTEDEVAVLILHRHFVIDFDAPSPSGDFLAGQRIDRGLVV